MAQQTHQRQAAQTASTVDVPVYTQTGTHSGNASLPASVIDQPFNPDLVHQVVVGMQANARTPLAHTKDRGDVSGGGKKPWPQKGTGNARHGSTRSPIWKGGGVTFGPRNEKDYTKKINRKMRGKALLCTLSQKYRDGEVFFVDELQFEHPKTATAKGMIEALAGATGANRMTSKAKNAVLILTAEYKPTVIKSFSNLPHVAVGELRDTNPVELLQYTYVVIEQPNTAGEFLGSKAASTKRS
jgi:large subunit ribosomal protein L4